MKTKKTALAILAAASCLVYFPTYGTHFAIADEAPHPGNPFAEGTGAIPITEETRRQLLDYALSSRNELLEVLRSIDGQPDDAAAAALVSRFCRIVVRSHQTTHGSELLFRIALNQALELVHGLPADASCTRLVSPALLSIHGSSLIHGIPAETAIARQVLTESGRLALELAETDQQVIDRMSGKSSAQEWGTKYPALGQRRLTLARGWVPSAAFLGVRHETMMLRGILQQWLNVALHPNNSHRLLNAALIVRTQAVLTETMTPADGGGAQWSGVARKLRRHLSEMLEDTQKD